MLPGFWKNVAGTADIPGGSTGDWVPREILDEVGSEEEDPRE